MSEIRCPKCDSDKTEISNFRMGQTELRYCRECYVYWTDWQQSEIASLRAKLAKAVEMLKRLEWSSRSTNYDGRYLAICPICGISQFCNIPLSERVHTSDCALAALLKEIEG